MAQRHKATVPAIIRPLLGTMSDVRLAAQCHTSCTTLRRWRIQAGITPYRLNRAAGQRYLDFLRQHPAGLTAQKIATAMGVTRQGAFLMLHFLARREVIACVTRPNLRRYGGRAHRLFWRLIPKERGAPCQD